MGVQKKTKIKFDKIGKIAAVAEIETIRLVSANVSNAIKSPNQFSLELKAKTNTTFKIKNDLLLINVAFELQGIKNREKRPVLSINAGFELLYRMQEVKFSDDDLNKFAHVNGTYNAWPYWREFVQNTTVRMGLPALTVPLFKVCKEVVIRDNR